MMENLENLYKKAVMIAQEAHKGQLDKGGNPYIEHPLYVASQVDTMELKIVAVLHDTLEDSDMTANDLKKEGFPERIVDAIVMLTHEDGNEEAYLDYIRRVATNTMAAAVKKADLMHNMDMPLSLEELGIPCTDENLKILEDYLIDSPYVDPSPESLALLHEAMKQMQ